LISRVEALELARCALRTAGRLLEVLREALVHGERWALVRDDRSRSERPVFLVCADNTVMLSATLSLR